MSDFNLLDEQWVRVVREDGSLDKIAPHQIADKQNPPVDIGGGSLPDIRTGYIQFLIGLVQTTYAPENNLEWIELWESPPEPSDLKRAFDEYHEAFYLTRDGDGPLFMQIRGDIQNQKGLGKLAHDDNFFNSDTDLEKNVPINLNPRNLDLRKGEVAALLYSAQSTKKYDGRGSATCLRGTAKPTTIIMGETLWETIWLNVLNEQHFHELNHNSISDPEDFIFRWMNEDEDLPKEITPEEAHPYHAYWSMCQGASFVFDDEEFQEYHRPTISTGKPDGWEHPLVVNDERIKQGFDIREWTKFRLEDMSPVLRAFEERSPYIEKDVNTVWVFGAHHIANDPFKGFIDRRMPILAQDVDTRRALNDEADRIISVVENLEETFRTYYLDVNPSSKSQLGSRQSKPNSNQIKYDLWSMIESKLTKLLMIMRQKIEGGDVPVQEKYDDFKNHLKNVFEEAFDRMANFQNGMPNKIIVDGEALPVIRRNFQSKVQSEIEKLELNIGA